MSESISPGVNTRPVDVVLAVFVETKQSRTMSKEKARRHREMTGKRADMKLAQLAIAVENFRSKAALAEEPSKAEAVMRC